jgi:formate dehydrogenase maturation protein FdhE
MNKKKFKKIMHSFDKNEIDLEHAWEVYLRMLKLFKYSNGDETLEYLERLACMDQKQKLIWRNKLAEMGIELTPSQVDDYIFILSLAATAFWTL